MPQIINERATEGLTKCLDLLAAAARQVMPLEEGLAGTLELVCKSIGSGNVLGVFNYKDLHANLLSEQWPSLAVNELKQGEYGLIDVVRRSNKIALVPNIDNFKSKYYREYPLSAPFTIRSELAAPIVVSETFVGAIDLVSDVVDGFSESEAMWLQLIVKYIEHHSMGFEAGSSYINDLIAGKEINQILHGILVTALESTNLRAADAAMLIVHGDRVVDVGAVQVRNNRYDSYRVPGSQEWSPAKGITGRALRTRTPLFIGNVKTDPDYFGGERLPVVVSEAALPIMRGDNVIGLLSLHAPIPDAFTDDAQAALQLVAQRASLPLFVAQLGEMVEREKSVLDKLSELMPYDTFALHREYVLDHILVATFNLLSNSTSCQILEVEQDLHATSRMLHIRLGFIRKLGDPVDANLLPRDGKLMNSKFKRHPFELGVTGAAARTGKIEYRANVKILDTPAAYLPYNGNTITELAIPLNTGDKVIGVLNIESTEEDAFSARDKTVAALLAISAGLALSNEKNYPRVVDLFNSSASDLTALAFALDNMDGLFERLVAWIAHLTDQSDCRVSLSLYDSSADPNHYHSGPSKRQLKSPSRFEMDLNDSTGNKLATLEILSGSVNTFGKTVEHIIRQHGPLISAAIEANLEIGLLKIQHAEMRDYIEESIHLFSSPLQKLGSAFESGSAIKDLSESRELASVAGFLNTMLNWLRLLRQVFDGAYENLPRDFIDVDALASQLIRKYAWYAKMNSVTLIYFPRDEALEPSDTHALVHQAAVEGALMEMLNNAMKYAKSTTAHSTISVQVERLISSIYVYVQDEGIGVPLGDQERIWKRRQRATNVGNRVGSGLGLYFVRHVMEMFGGTANMRTRGGEDGNPVQGSRFWIEIPAVESMNSYTNTPSGRVRTPQRKSGGR